MTNRIESILYNTQYGEDSKEINQSIPNLFKTLLELIRKFDYDDYKFLISLLIAAKLDSIHNNFGYASKRVDMLNRLEHIRTIYKNIND